MVDGSLGGNDTVPSLESLPGAQPRRIDNRLMCVFSTVRVASHQPDTNGKRVPVISERVSQPPRVELSGGVEAGVPFELWRCC